MEQPLSFERLPEAVGQVLSALSEIRTLIVSTAAHAAPAPLPSVREPIGVDEACRLLQKAKPTIYHLARTGILPSYKRGKKIYFFSDELLSYVSEGYRKTVAEIQEEASFGYGK